MCNAQIQDRLSKKASKTSGRMRELIAIYTRFVLALCMSYGRYIPVFCLVALYADYFIERGSLTFSNYIYCLEREGYEHLMSTVLPIHIAVHVLAFISVIVACHKIPSKLAGYGLALCSLAGVTYTLATFQLSGCL